MKVNEILKGKSALEKEQMLQNKNLDQSIVDKLVADPAKSVRNIAVYHLNASQEALYKASFAKKNHDDQQIMMNIFWKLDLEYKFKFLKERKWKKFENRWIIDELDDAIYSGIEKTDHKDELTEIFREEFMNGEHFNFIKNWLLKYANLKSDRVLYEYFFEKYPDKLIVYKDIQKFTTTQVDDQFKKYIDSISRYAASPYKDLRPDFIENMDKSQIDLLVDSGFNLNSDDFRVLKNNKNLTAEHTEKILNKMGNWSSDAAYVAEHFPLNQKVEKMLYAWFMTKGLNGVAWKILEHWALNPTHDKKFMMNLLINWKITDGLSIQVIYNLLTSGKYSQKDLDEIYKNKPSYYKDSAEVTLIKNKNFPKEKLRELWNTNWSKWGKKEVNGPIRSNVFSGDFFKTPDMSEERAEINKILYYLLTKSSLKGEFGLKYFKDTNDDSYLSEETKDIFLF